MSAQFNLPQQLSQAVNFHQAGQLDRAEHIYREILRRAPKNEHALGFLGRLYLQKGLLEEGAKYARLSLQVNPRQPDALNNLGYALLQLKQNEESLASFETLIAMQPGYAPAYYNRGNALLNLARYDAAIDSYGKGLALRPNHPESWVGLGQAFKCLERYDEALDCCRKALAINPQQVEAWNNLGNVLRELNRLKEGLVAYGNALSIKPDYAEVYNNRAQMLAELGRFEEAVQDMDRYGALGKSDRFDYLLSRGDVAQSASLYEEALACFGEAERLRPDSAVPLVKRGSVLVELGDLGAAGQSYLQAVDRDPQDIGGYNGLAEVEKPDGSEAWFRSLEEIYRSRGLRDETERVVLGFAMGKALESAGRYEAAFSAYQEGNGLFYKSHRFDRAGLDEKREKDQAYFTGELFSRCAVAAQELPPYEDERVPIFIVGMPRSGTTLIEQVLSSHPSFFGAGELNDQDDIIEQVRLPAHGAGNWVEVLNELRGLGRQYMDRVWRRAPDARYISNKMPGNFANIGILSLMLPNAKFIHAMRDPMDSCFSCYSTRFKFGHYYSFDLVELGHYYRSYAAQMAHWHAVLPTRSILDFRYEQMVADPEREAHRLLEYVGLTWDSACLKFYENKRAVKTASFAQVRKPIYTTSVARWQHFEKHLGPLLELVSEYR